nr:hypothetical protein [uncultured Microbacterium sp.]
MTALEVAALPSRWRAPHDHTRRERLVGQHTAEALRVPLVDVPGSETSIVQAVSYLECVESLLDQEPVRVHEHLALAVVGHGMGGLLEAFQSPPERRVPAGPLPRLTFGTLAAGGLLNDGIAVHLRER